MATCPTLRQEAKPWPFTACPPRISTTGMILVANTLQLLFPLVEFDQDRAEQPGFL